MTDKECEEKLVRIAKLVYRINAETDYTVRFTNFDRVVYISIQNRISVRFNANLDDRYVRLGYPSIEDVIAKLEEIYGGN